MRLPSLVCTLALAACSGDTSDSHELTVEKLLGATYRDVLADPVTLEDGRFEGEPFMSDSVSGPVVTLVPDVLARGDLGSDGNEEAAVVLAHNSGGSGVFMFLAVVRETGGKPENVATIGLGDRVRVSALGIDDGKLIADLVEHAPDDPMCCPTREIRREWHFRDGQLFPLGQETESEGGRFRGHLVWGHESRSFTECGGDHEGWVINDSGEELIEVYEELTSTPYQPMFVEVRGEWVDPPTDGFGAEYADALRITDLVRAENEGFGCRLDLEDLLFVASGNEPSWRLQIREDGISMRSMDVPGENVFSGLRTQAKASRVIFEAEGPESVIAVTLERRRCIDTMSGARYAWAAAIDIDGRHLEGCAAEGL